MVKVYCCYKITKNNEGRFVNGVILSKLIETGRKFDRLIIKLKTPITIYQLTERDKI